MGETEVGAALTYDLRCNCNTTQAMPSDQGKPEGISSRVFCKVGSRTELLIVPDATQPVYLAPHFLRAPLSDQPLMMMLCLLS